ncbi:MAG: efflux RND transporter permease subunit [Bdellovibrionales bacterium]|nr:efflux RND transporter permease subunit [Bdellovibrionales bacterium]
MNKIFEYFIQRSFLVNMICVFVTVVGVLALISMKRDLVPPFQFKNISINATLPGASPEEMERFVTYPLEEALAGLNGVKKMTSSSANSQTRIYLEYGVEQHDMNQALMDVEGRVEAARVRLPESIKEINVRQDKNDRSFLYYLAIENFNPLNDEHRRFGKEFEDRLLKVEGVITAEVNMQERNLHIQFVPRLLKKYEISIPQVYHIIRQNMEIAPIGLSKIDFEEYGVEISRSVVDLNDLRNLPIHSNLAGYSLRLKDIAKVGWKLSENRNLNLFNNHSGVNVEVLKSFDHDTIDLKNKVKPIIAEFNQKAPKGLVIKDFVNGPQFVEQQIRVLAKNGTLGLLLVLLTLVIFLNWRIAIMTSLGLPIAYLGTAIVLHFMGIGIDLVSLIGMILVVGILVDDAIIVSERYDHLLRLGFSPKEAASRSATKLFLPVTATILTTIVAFAPLILIDSWMSEVLKAVPVVVIVALAFSWFESFFLLPNHLAHFVKKPTASKVDVYFEKVRKAYERSLEVVIRWRYPVFIASFALLGLAGYIGATKLKHDFDLSVNSEKIVVYMILKESKSLEETASKTKALREKIQAMANKDIENTEYGAGWTWRNGQYYRGARFSRFQAYVDRNHSHPTEVKRRLQAKIDKLLQETDRSQYEHLYSSIEMQGKDEEKDQMVAIRIEGGEDHTFDEIEDVIVSKVKEIPLIKEYARDEERFQKTWRFTPKVEELNRYGVQPLELSQQVRSFFAPDEIIETRMGGEKVIVYGDRLLNHNPQFADLGNVQFLGETGAAVPLRFLGSWKQSITPKKISHLNGSRQLTMDFRVDLSKGNTTVAKEKLGKVVESLQKSHPGFRLSVIDSDEHEAENATWALKVGIICIFSVLFIIALLLGSVTQPLVVGLPIPFGLMGIIFALYLHQDPLGIMALIGLIGTVGVAVNASIVMMDEINQRLAENQGVDFQSMVIEGSGSRLRAIMLTTITTLVGVMPMAYSLGGESGYTQPMAFSMGWGLLTVTITTMFLLPSLLMVRQDILNGIAKLVNWKFGKARTQKAIEELLPSPQPLEVPKVLDSSDENLEGEVLREHLEAFEKCTNQGEAPGPHS